MWSREHTQSFGSLGLAYTHIHSLRVEERDREAKERLGLTPPPLLSACSPRWGGVLSSTAKRFDEIWRRGEHILWTRQSLDPVPDSMAWCTVTLHTLSCVSLASLGSRLRAGERDFSGPNNPFISPQVPTLSVIIRSKMNRPCVTGQTDTPPRSLR